MIQDVGKPMIRNIAVWTRVILVAIAIGCVTFSASSQQAVAPVSIVVSAEAKFGKDIPTIYREDVRVFHDKDRLQVTDWIPLQGERAGLDLALLIDDSSNTDLGLQLDDLRKFINGQPVTTTIRCRVCPKRCR